jgi:hypothetical protein
MTEMKEQKLEATTGVDLSQSTAPRKCDHYSIVASLDCKTFEILPGTVNVPDYMRKASVKEEDTDSPSRPSSPHESDFSYLLDSDPEQDELPPEEFQPDTFDPGDADPLEQPYMEMHYGRLSSSAPPFYHPGFMGQPFPHPEFPFTMPMYFAPEGSEGWAVRVKKKKKAGKNKKKHNKMTEGGSPKSKKKNKKKNKKKDRVEEFDANGQKKYKSKNRRHSSWTQRSDNGVWTSGEFRSIGEFNTPLDSRSRSSSGASDSWSGGFSSPPLARRPDWLNPSAPLPLYAQVF